MNTSATDNDWRRQPLVWFVIGVLGFTAVASFTLLFIAASNPPELVVENYANIEELTEQTRAQDKTAAQLGLTATVAISEPEATLQVLRIELQSQAVVDWPATLSVRTANSTRSALDSEALFRGAGGVYIGTLPLPPNAYDLHLESPGGEWRLTARAVGKPATLTLQPYVPGTAR